MKKLRPVFSCKNKVLSQSQTEAEQRANEKKKEEREKKTKKKSGAKRQKRASRVANCNFFVKMVASVPEARQLDDTRKLPELELTWNALERQMMHRDHARTDSGQSEKEKEAKKIACSLGASHADTLMYMMKTAGRGHTNVPSRSQKTKDTAVDFAHDANRRWAHLVGTWRPDQATLVSAFMLADAECAVTLAFDTEAALASNTPLYYVHLLPSEDEIFLIEGEELTGRLMVPPGPQGDRGSANCVSIADLLRIIRRHRPQRDVASTHWTSFPKEDEHWSTPYHSLTIEQALDGVRNEDRSQQDLIKDCYAVLESATRIRRFHATMPSPSHANDPSTAIPPDPPRKAGLLLPSRMVQSRSQSAGRVQLAVLAFLPVPLCLRSSRTLTMAEFDTTFCTSSLGLNIFDMHCVDGNRKYHPCLMAQITVFSTCRS